jgi:hypothetical protein
MAKSKFSVAILLASLLLLTLVIYIVRVVFFKREGYYDCSDGYDSGNDSPDNSNKKKLPEVLAKKMALQAAAAQVKAADAAAQHAAARELAADKAADAMNATAKLAEAKKNAADKAAENAEKAKEQAAASANVYYVKCSNTGVPSITLGSAGSEVSKPREISGAAKITPTTGVSPSVPASSSGLLVVEEDDEEDQGDN